MKSSGGPHEEEEENETAMLREGRMVSRNMGVLDRALNMSQKKGRWMGERPRSRLLKCRELWP